jgi:drug/metabolite transporter (DMT)-like permease
MGNKPEKTQSSSNTLIGIAFMILNALCISITVITSKQLAQSLHPNQVVFLYKIVVLAVIIPWCFFGGIKKNLKTKKLGLHVSRGALSVIGHLCFMSALYKMNALDVTALAYLEPIIIMIIGVVYFKEQFTITKVTMLILSLLGALFISCPSIITGEAMPIMNKYYIYIFLALIFWAMNNVSVKILGKTEHTKAQLFYLTSVSSIISLPIAMQDWRPLEWWHLKFLVILGASHLLHSVSFFKALKKADISIVMPFDYTRLVFTGLLAYMFLNEVPSDTSMIGYLLITLGGIIFIRQETINYRKKTKKAKEEKIKELEAEYELDL